MKLTLERSRVFTGFAGAPDEGELWRGVTDEGLPVLAIVKTVVAVRPADAPALTAALQGKPAFKRVEAKPDESLTVAFRDGKPPYHLTTFEYEILAECAGDRPVQPWGAAVGAALEELAQRGLVQGGRITELGRGVHTARNKVGA